MSKPRCLLALAFLGSMTFLPVFTKADAANPDIPSICDAVAGNMVKNCGFETGNFSAWTVTREPSFGHLDVVSSPHSGNSCKRKPQ